MKADDKGEFSSAISKWIVCFFLRWSSFRQKMKTTFINHRNIEKEMKKEYF